MGPAPRDARHAAEEAPQDLSEEKEVREEQDGRCRVCQDPRAEAEGAEGGQGAAPQEDCFSEGVQEVRQQPVDTGQVAVVSISCDQAILANLKQPAGKQLYLHVIVSAMNCK